MPLDKIVEVAGKSVTVRELTFRELHAIASAEADNAVDAVAVVLSTCSGLQKDQMMDLCPSDTVGLIEEVIRINSPFLHSMDKLGVTSTRDAMEKLIRSCFSAALLR